MSDFSDKFLKRHKKWIDRTREYLLSSTWHEQKVLDCIREREENAGEPLKEYAAVSVAEGVTETKADGLKNDFNMAKNMTSRLGYYLKNTEGEKHTAKNKKVREEILEPIQIFLSNCNYYIEENRLEDLDNQKVRNLEIEFQDKLFNYKIKIEDELDKLGVFDEHEAISIRFFKGEQASLIMREPLVLKNPDIAIRTEAIPVDFNVGTSKEMLINMNKKDIPPWNPKKHFFEQETSTIQFWQEEYHKMKNGININGYFIHPWLYHHLNIFMTKIPISQNQEPVMNPPLRDNEWFFVENLKKAEDAGDKGLMLYGTRRFSKSTIMASYIEWKAKTKFNSVATLTGGSETDLIQLLDKVDTSLMYGPAALRLILQKTDGDRTNGIMHMGLKLTASDLLDFSQIQVQNLAQGRKSSSQKTAGGAPSAFVVDEIGKFPFLGPYLAALPAFSTPHGYKCVPILSGTGGEADLSQDAMIVLRNPEAYNLLPMDWDMLESKIDPDYITWKRRIFTTYMPGQMGYESGFKYIEKPFSEFLGMESGSELDKIIIKQADFKNNNEVLLNIRAKAEAEKGTAGKRLLQQKKVQNPMDPEDCFITLEGNPFPSAEAKVHRQFIEETGDVGRKVILDMDAHGNIVDHPADDKDLADFPFAGGFHNAPVQLFEPLPKEQPPFGLYVAGMDDYKHDQSDGDSVGTLYIYKRNWFDPTSLSIVASYASRPNPRSEFDRQCYYMLKAFNAVLFHENEDNNFKSYLDKKHETELYLAKGFDFASELNLNNNGNRKYGWPATPKNIEFGYSLIKKYLEEEFEVEMEDGTTKTILGVKRIKDVGLLSEIESFTKDGNFDRLRGFMGALMYAHYLDTTYNFPKPQSQRDQEQRKKERNSLSSRISPYRKRTGSAFRK